MRAVLLCVLALSLTGCGVAKRFGFGGSEPEAPLPFQSKLNKGEARAFSVQVVARGASLDEVRESARYPATSYCLLTFGGSAIDWTMGADGDWATQRSENGDLTVSGTCAVR